MKKLGADVDTNISGKTNFLLAGEEVGSSKLKKMHDNIQSGKEAQILTESELLIILNQMFCDHNKIESDN